MTVAPEVLDELLTTASAGLNSAKFSEAIHRRAGSTKGEELASEASEALRRVCDGLEALGAKDKGDTPAPVNPLTELSRVENSRREALTLLDGLKALLPIAENLDVKRGDVLTEPVNGYRGTEWNDRLVQMCSELELELFGPSEAVTKGRE